MNTSSRVLCKLLVALGTAWPGALCAADPTLSVPATVNVSQAPSLAIIPATTNCSWVAYYPLDPGVQVVPPALLKDSRTCVAFVTSPQGGRIVAFAGNDTAAAPVVTCTITVGTMPPTPPPPTPPPSPTDPLAQAVQTAYAADTGAKKATLLPSLEALYSIAGNKTVNDPTYTTVAALLAKIKLAREGLMQDTDLAGVQTVIDADLAKFTPTQALDAPTRTALAQELLHVATALDAAALPSQHSTR